MALAAAVLVAAGLVMAAPPVKAAPPDSTEPPGEGPADAPGGHPADQAGESDAALDDGASTDFERRLAEVDFAIFLSTDMAMDSGTFSCSEPPSLERGTAITCFTIINGDRLLVATTTVSAGTAEYDFEIIADMTLGASPAGTGPTGTLAPPSAADAAVLANGQAINDSSAAFVAQYLTDPRIAAVPVYAFDPATGTLTLELSLAPGSGIDADALAWANAQTFAQHQWAAGQPFRTDGATVRPSFVLVVDGAGYPSSFDVMAGIADGMITMDQWLAAVGHGP
jgi:hypothetical protein